MKEYWFGTTGWDNGTCTERCMLKDNGVMIGSVKCRECENCIKHQEPCAGNVDWIVCSKLDEAKGK